MIVSVGIVALNEEKYIEDILNDVLYQTFPTNEIELLLIDSGSSDATCELMANFRDENKKQFFDIKILTNERMKQAAGWNVAIKNFTGDILIRVDAHAKLANDFIEQNVILQNEGEFVTGGPRGTISLSNGFWSETLLLAEQSLFGSSVAPYRRSSSKSYVNSLFHGAYRREVLENVGLFDEDLGRTEDNDYHYRVRMAGYNICYSPKIKSWQYVRNNLRNMIKQKFYNGYWIALTVKKDYRCLSLYHFVPFLFVLAIIITTILSLFGSTMLSTALWTSYCLLAIVMAFMSSRGKYKYVKALLLPFLFFMLHIAYGIGTMCGFLKYISFDPKFNTAVTISEKK